MKYSKEHITELNLNNFREHLNHLTKRWNLYLSSKSITALIHYLKGYKNLACAAVCFQGK